MTGYNIVPNGNDPFNRSIKLFLAREFPILGTCSGIDTEDLVDMIFTELMILVQTMSTNSICHSLGKRKTEW